MLTPPCVVRYCERVDLLFSQDRVLQNVMPQLFVQTVRHCELED